MKPSDSLWAVNLENGTATEVWKEFNNLHLLSRLTYEPTSGTFYGLHIGVTHTHELVEITITGTKTSFKSLGKFGEKSWMAD